MGQLLKKVTRALPFWTRSKVLPYGELSMGSVSRVQRILSELENVFATKSLSSGYLLKAGAKVYAQLKEIPKACQLLDQLLDRYIVDLDTFRFAGHTYFQHGDSEKALAQFSEVVRENPQDEEASSHSPW